MADRIAPLHLTFAVDTSALDDAQVARQQLCRELAVDLPTLAQDLNTLQGDSPLLDAMQAFERLVVLAPESFNPNDFLHGREAAMQAEYDAQLGPSTRSVGQTLVLPPTILNFQRIARLWPLLDGRPLEQVVQLSPLDLLSTCATVSLLQQLDIIRLGRIPTGWTGTTLPAELPNLITPRASDPQLPTRDRIAQRMRAFQQDQRETASGNSPWVRARLWWVPAPALPRLEPCGALVLLIDALDTTMVWQIEHARGWQTRDFGAKELEGHAILVPTGAMLLRGKPLHGRAFQRRIVMEPGHLYLYRFHSWMREWQQERVALEF